MASVWIVTRRNKNGKVHSIRWEITPKGEDRKPLKDESGETVRVTGSETVGPSMNHALSRAKDISDDLAAGKLQIKPKVKFTTVSALVSDYLDNSQKTKAPGTFKNFDDRALRHFEKWFGGKKPLSMLEVQTLLDWRDAMLKGLASTTVHMRLRALCAALNYAKERNYIAENPFERIRRSTLFPPTEEIERYLSHEEIKVLLPALTLDVAGAVYFVLHTGLRHSELLSLDWKMIHRSDKGPWTMEITRASAHGIRTGHKVKTRKARVVEIPDKARAVMGEPKAFGNVFGWKTQNAIQPQIRKAAEDLKLGRIRLHDCRHTWATNFMYQTGNVFELMYRGGWSSMASAAVYQHTKKRDEPVEYLEFPHYSHTKAPVSTTPDVT